MTQQVQEGKSRYFYDWNSGRKGNHSKIAGRFGYHYGAQCFRIISLLDNSITYFQSGIVSILDFNKNTAPGKRHDDVYFPVLLAAQ